MIAREEDGKHRVVDQVLMYVSEDCVPLMREYTDYIASLWKRRLYVDDPTFSKKGFDLLGTVYLMQFDDAKNLHGTTVNVPVFRGEIDVLGMFWFGTICCFCVFLVL